MIAEALTIFKVQLVKTTNCENYAPDASLDDGKFTMIIVKTSNLAKMLHLMTLVLNGGKHINDPSIIYVKTSKVVAKPADKDRLMINLDGEYGCDAPMTFRNLKQHIEMFADTDRIPDEAITDTDPELEDAERHFVSAVDQLPAATEDCSLYISDAAADVLLVSFAGSLFT